MALWLATYIAPRKSSYTTLCLGWSVGKCDDCSLLSLLKLMLHSAIHGYIALKTVPTVLSEFSHTQKRVYCCAECKRESKKRHGKDDDGDDEDDERILLLQGQDSSQAV